MAFKPTTDALSAGYFLILLILIIAFLVSLYVSKRNKGNGSNILGKAKILDKAYLDNKVKMYVVEYEGKKFIIVENGSAITISENITE
ncbi:hypothetical protein [Enterovibrio norvegicus]|uniref:Flagellar protein n=1 Tax=Enterovibrio norvegicus TaxID=188144 RepID=A0ABV4L6W4_9GAMM|nr:hypothetical protein [Enterovibrio norvegicus]OEF55563.1 hypothetical protein A1OU_24720 [Enterovibrio norvegicus]